MPSAAKVSFGAHFVPKLIITAICLAIFGSSILVLLTDFTRDLFAQIPNLVR